MNDLLKNKTVFIETSDSEVGSVIIVNSDDACIARTAIEKAKNIWFNHEDSDERYDLLSDQIQHALEDYNIFFDMPDFEEI